MSSVVLNEEQQHAIEVALQQRLCVITGPPGSGKTTLVKELIARLQAKNMLVLLCAPTGNAVNVLSTKCGVEAHVIDMIDSNKNLIEAYQHACIIIDEASMLQNNKLVRFWNTMNPRSICIVGDSHQLPCVGNFPALNTICSSSQVPRVRLTSNHRRKDDIGSCLFRCIQHMGEDDFRVEDYLEDGSLQVIRCQTEQDVIVEASVLFFERPSQMISFSRDMVQKLSEATESSKPLVVGSIHEGDRVVCEKNYYVNKVLTVPNGMIGTCNRLSIQYSNGFRDYYDTAKRSFNTLFIPARCLTAHKCQGSEFKERGIVVLSKWKGPLPLENLYTAMTRFQGDVAVVGTDSQVSEAFSRSFLNKHDEEFVALLDKMCV